MFGFDQDYAPLATMSDAHSEWHRNAGVPMGQPGCPQDACDPYMFEEYDELSEAEVAAAAASNGFGFPVNNYPFAEQVEPPF